MLLKEYGRVAKGGHLEDSIHKCKEQFQLKITDQVLKKIFEM